MRILVTACPLHGHVNAVLPVAEAARRAGHDVVVATGADFAAYVERRGIHAWAVGPTSAAAGMPESIDFFVRTAAERIGDLRPLVRSWSPDLVVAEELELAGPVVAALSGADYVVHGLGISATVTAPATFAPLIDEFGQRWAAQGVGKRYTCAPYVAMCPPALRPDYLVGRPLYALRPAVGTPAGDDRLPDALLQMPHDRSVHLTLGTVFHQLRPTLLETAIAAIAELPVNLIVTTGPDVDPTRFGPQPEHVLIESYLPHALLLARCDAVVSHGGAGVLLGALAHGLPQCVLPQAADQFGNGAAVQRAGAGIILDSEPPGPRISEAVSKLLADAAYADAARAVQEEIAAMPGPSEVVARLIVDRVGGGE